MGRIVVMGGATGDSVVGARSKWLWLEGTMVRAQLLWLLLW